MPRHHVKLTSDTEAGRHAHDHRYRRYAGSDEEYKWGFSKPENYVFKSRKGLSHEIVEEISEMKGEPQWMRDFRHKSLDIFSPSADADLGR